jgi:hypothetical protein
VPTLNGDWAPFNRCPVDNPAMHSASYRTDIAQSHIATCLASDSPSGSIKLGNVTVPTGDTNLQAGLVEDTPFGQATLNFSVFPPVGGAVLSAPIHTPGGLLALMCPSSSPPASSICRQVHQNPSLNDVTATAESAGTPSNFNLFGGLGTGVPIITLPIKIHLENPFLTGNCYIGSDSNPIVLNPENTVAPTFGAEAFDGNGTPDPNGVMSAFVLTGANQGDSSFAVPAATGCGPGGVADATINSRVGLPSPSGKNNLVLNNASSDLALLSSPNPNDGQQLATNWHSAVLP